MLSVNSLIDEGTQEDPELTLQRKAFKSKLLSLNTHLEALIQKKIRIDLEIKRTRKSLSKMKQKSTTLLKTSIQLEGVNPESEDPKDYQVLLEAWSPEDIRELAELEKEAERAEFLLQAYQDLPLFED